MSRGPLPNAERAVLEGSTCDAATWHEDKMTQSTQPADMSKSAPAVDTFEAQLADLKAALDRFPFLNEAAPVATYEVWDRWRQVTMPAFIVQLVAAADRARELEADARRWRVARAIGVIVPGTLYGWRYREKADAAIDRAQGETR